MTTGATGQLGLALPVQGELSGTWGDTVNNGITQYTNIAIAATLTLTNDGAVTLANTTGDASASNITSTLTGAGTVTAQFAIVRVTGTLTTAKVVTAPSYSKTYTVVNAATGGIVTFKAAGQTGVSIAVGESAFVYFNGTDYVKVSGTSAVSSFTAGTTGLTPNTATTGAVTLAGTLATTNGGTGLTSFTSGGVVYASSSSALATGSALTFNGTNLGLGITLSNWSGGFKAIQNQGTTILSGGTLDGYMAQNYFNDGANKYIATGFATSYGQSTGQHIWYNAPSGAANASVTFTQAMTLDNSGNLGIGTSSPATKLHVNNTTGGVQVRASSDSDVSFSAVATAADSTAFFTVLNDARQWTMRVNGAESDQFQLRDSTAGATRLVVNSSGEVGIGTTAPTQPLTVQADSSAEAIAIIGRASSSASRLDFQNNANTTRLFAIGVSDTAVDLFADANIPMVFATNNAERARISNTGGFSVGTTANPGVGAIYATGNITAYYSDARLKTVSGKIENALDKVAQLSGVYYTNNSVAKSFGYDSDEVQVGVLAQDVEAVLPQIVKAAPFDLDADGNSKSGENYKTVQYERLVPLLIEAINELQAKVKALESK